MFRITQYMKAIHESAPVRPARKPPGPVVIWNLIRRCNLACKHCYTTSIDMDFPGELSTQQVYDTMADLRQYGVPVLILSGGEPLLRPDIYDIGRRAKELGFYVGLSSNGTLINDSNIKQIAEVGFDYVGISIDGLEEYNDSFRRMDGGYQAALNGVKLCKAHGIKVGWRFTLTQENAGDLPALLDITREMGIEKFYLSHLNYSGRGKKSREEDAYYQTTRKAMNMLFERCWEDLEAGRYCEYVTGNNDADGVYLLKWCEENKPEYVPQLRQILENWGGNSSGVNISNIDNTGTVHPDTFWWNYNLGNVKETPFSEIWENTPDPLMAQFRQSPRPLKGRCAECDYLSICGGNTRVRAYNTTKDAWAEDPGCYLTNSEIGVNEELERVPHANPIEVVNV